MYQIIKRKFKIKYMNREIKFRAWDKYNKKMHYQPEVNFHFFDDEFTCVLNEHDQVVVQPESVVVMQFTGLLDKNGKEIYEGDILSHKYYSMPVICEFVDGSFIFDDISKYDESLEVIGNIYENPELLTANLK
jgi:hypothetical protein